MDNNIELVKQFLDAGGPYDIKSLERKGTFCQSFYKGLEGKPMAEKTLTRYTWSNLGWRLGVVVAATTEENREEMAGLLYEMIGIWAIRHAVGSND